MTSSCTHQTLFEQGIAFQDQAQYEEAVACFQKATELKPDFIPAWVYQGIILEQLQRYEDAIHCYNTAIETNPNVADLWYNKGATLCKLSRYPEALACFDKVLEIEPAHAIVRTARLLTLANPPAPIELPKQTGEQEERQPFIAEDEASIALSQQRDLQVFKPAGYERELGEEL